MKIAVVTFCNNGNYGSELQAVAMNQLIESHGGKAEFCVIKSSSKLGRATEIIWSRLRNSASCMFNKEYRKLYKQLCDNSAAQQQIDSELSLTVRSFLNNEITVKRLSKRAFRKSSYDFYIVGSDQIWSPFCMPFRREYFLDFVSPQRKIAYAPSMGVNELPEFYIKKAMPYIARFSHLSAREISAKEAIESNTDKKVQLVLDPTLAAGRQFWEQKINDRSDSVVPDEPYVLCYFLGRLSKKKTELINRYSNGRKIIVLPYQSMEQTLDNSHYVCADPIEFISLIKNADYVFTDSFHGCCFSLIFEKPFTVFERTHQTAVKQTSRIHSLLNMFNTTQCICAEDKDFTESSPDYSMISAVMDEKRKSSLKFLSDALKI